MEKSITDTFENSPDNPLYGLREIMFTESRGTCFGSLMYSQLETFDVGELEPELDTYVSELAKSEQTNVMSYRQTFGKNVKSKGTSRSKV